MPDLNEFKFPPEFERHEYPDFKIIPVIDRRLEMISLQKIRIPPTTRRGLWHLVKCTRLVGFAEDLQYKNRGLNQPLDRPTTEAAFMKAVTKLYHNWDPRPIAAKRNGALHDPDNWANANYLASLYEQQPSRLKIEMLTQAKELLNSDAADKYWRQKQQKYPGLNIKCAWEPMTEAEEAKYMEFAKKMEWGEKELTGWVPEKIERVCLWQKMIHSYGLTPITEEERARWARWAKEEKDEEELEKTGAGGSKHGFAHLYNDSVGDNGFAHLYNDSVGDNGFAHSNNAAEFNPFNSDLMEVDGEDDGENAYDDDFEAAVEASRAEFELLDVGNLNGGLN